MESSNSPSIDRALWAVLLASMLCFPRIFPEFKLALAMLLLVLVLSSSRVLEFGSTLRFFSVTWFSCVLMITAVGFAYGNSTIALFDTIRVRLLEMLLLIVLVAAMSIKGISRLCLHVVTFANSYIGLFNLLFFTCFYNQLDISVFQMLDATPRMALHEGYSHIVTTNLSMSIITFPLGLLSFGSEKRRAIKVWQMLSCMLIGVSMLLSGRRIIWIVLAVTLVIFLFMGGRLKRHLRKVLVLGSSCIVIGLVLDVALEIISFEGIIERIVDAFVIDGDGENGNVRLTQAAHLWDGFLLHPIFGSGAGAVLDGYSRNVNIPWSFEMSYNVLLFNGGVVGFMLYAASLGSIVVATFKLSKAVDKYGVAVFAALISALVANATNPYFSSSFDFLVMLILPLMLVNAYETCSGADRQGEKQTR